MQKFSNLAQLLIYIQNNYNNKNFLNYKIDNQWQNFSSQEFIQKVQALSIALNKIGVKKGSSFANYSYQNPIWLIVDFSAILAGAITVPIFSNLAQENLFYQLQDATVDFFFTDNPEICHKVFLNFPHLTIITNGFKVDYATSLDELISSEINNISSEKIADFVKNTEPSDIATIVYSSGSTDKPKGVEISHQSLISQIHDSDEFFKLPASSVVLSYLPLAHIFERMVMCYYLSKGLSIYFVDDIKSLGNYMKEVSPTLMTTVPRALEKVFAKINNGIDNNNFVKKAIGKLAIKTALNKAPLSSKTIFDKLFDKLIYQKFRLALGGKIEMMICGGSPLSPDLEAFYWNIGVKIYCGYGLTECSPVLATNSPNNFRLKTVGKAFPSVELKLAEDKELLAKGINVMKKYHNLPEKTADVFVDGWFKTGDLAEIDQDGFVKIIGRKKEVFKNSNGKFIHPVAIEQKLVQNLGFLLGALIIAESRSFVSVLLFVDFDLIDNLRIKLGYHQEISKFLESQVLFNYTADKINKINHNLDKWEQIKKFKIITDKISVETNEITPSMKLKRSIIEQKYKIIIDNFYLN